MIKRIKGVITLLICLIIFPLSVNAASGSISITGTSQAVIGNTVTITVKLSSSTKIGSWDMDLNYDKNYLQLISATSEAGGINMVNSSSGITSKSYTFKFKALKKGNTKVSMASYQAFAYDDMSEMNLSAGSKTIKIMTQEELEATYSKDNNLKSLTVEGFELNEEFSKDVTNYTVTVPEDTKEITINATKNDSTATVSGDGTFEVTQGTNTFEIVVRAQNGAEKTYTLIVDVKDSNPINVTIDNKTLTVVKIKEYLPSINAYQETTVKINDFDIPAYKNDYTNITLVGLKDSEGNINLYIYDKENNKYSVYNEIKGSNLTIYPIETTKVLEGYEKGEITINEIKFNAFYVTKSSRFVIVYGINIETGEEGFFTYDKDSQSIIKYDNEMINKLIEQNKLYSYIIIGFSAILVLMFIILLTTRKKKKKKLKSEEKYEYLQKKENEEIKEEKKNEIIELNVKNNEEEMYDILETKKKKKRRKNRN